MSARRPNQRVGRFDQLPADEAKALLEALDSMSAPRKIWAAPSTARGWNVAFCSDDTPEDAKDRCEVYHHDDVVRELVEALDDMADLFSADNALKRGTHLNATLCRARRALAKIAQEG